jgi:hypothetical protein
MYFPKSHLNEIFSKLKQIEMITALESERVLMKRNDAIGKLCPKLES